MSEHKMVTIYTRGRCRVCGCTEFAACDLGAGFTCWWVDAAHTLCSSPLCLAVVPLREIERDSVPVCGEDPGPVADELEGNL